MSSPAALMKMCSISVAPMPSMMRIPVACRHASKVARAPLLDERRGGAGAHREEHQSAQPEGEGERRRADEDVVRLRAQDVARKAVRDREDVSMEMHRPLALAGRSRREGNERDV